MKFNLNILLLIFIVNSAIIFGINYLIGQNSLYIKYSMPNNFLEFNGTESSAFTYEDIKGLENFTMIVETGINDEVIGLYDPVNQYYEKSTKFIEPDSFRYFSNEDYETGRNVSIHISDIYEVMRTGTLDLESLGSSYNTEFIHTFDFGSAIYEEPILFVKNLFALDSNDFTKLYVFNEEQAIDETKVIHAMQSFGFEYIKQNHFQILKDTLKLGLFGGLFLNLITISIFANLLMLTMGIIIYNNTKYKQLYLHKVLGANRITYTFNFIKYNGALIIVVLLTSTLLTSGYLHHIDKYHMNPFLLLMVNVAVLMIILLTIIISIIFLFTFTSRRRRI